MAASIYLLCMLTSLACAWLLYRSYLHSRHRLLFWSTLCFAGLTVSNLILIIDRLVLPEVDISTPRLLVSLVAVALLLYGLIWEEE
jgi:hypothetical protein